MRRSLPYLAFAAVTLVAFWRPLLLGRTVLPVTVPEIQRGLPIQEPSIAFRPERPRVRINDGTALLPILFRVYNDGLKRGELALWNPYLYCGVPLYYDTMVHPFYPPHLLLHAVLPPDAAFTWTLALHFFASGAAMFLLLRGLGRSPPAATLGGLAWMLLGYNALWFTTGILLGVSVFGPLALLALRHGAARRDLSFAALAGAALGLAALGSHPQHALHVGLLALAWTAVAGRGDRPFALRLGLLTALLAAGVGLAAELTRLESIAHGYRDPSHDAGNLYKASVLPHLLGLVLGKVFLPDDPHVVYEFTIYAGLGVAALAVGGAWLGRREPDVLFAGATAVVCLLVAFVRPLGALTGVVPLFNLSPPARLVYLAGFGVVLLAARGADALAAHPRGRRAVAVAAGLLALPVLVLWRNPTGVETLIGFALVAAAALVPRPLHRGGLAFAAVLFELLVPFVTLHAWPADPAPLRTVPPHVAAVRPPEPWRGTGLVGATPFDRPHLTDLMYRELVEGNNLLAAYGVENVAGFEAIAPEPYVRFARAAGAHYDPAGRSLVFADLRSPLLDLANLTHAFLPPSLPAPPDFRKIAEDGRVAVYENPAALPRAWVVGRALRAGTPEEARDLARSPGFDPRTHVVLEGARDVPSLPPRTRGDVRWVAR
ncbi:MAG TPA: hypothetical protein VEJ18_04695, partial [Planctomycetota bacterium]|nr:hypothetical protein [Planctomycetota bacterium]